MAFEEQSDTKHEYAKGRVYAMADNSIQHGIITVNASNLLKTQLQNTDCAVAVPNTRVKINETQSYRYPDLVIGCGKSETIKNHANTTVNPTVIVEVTSSQTAIVDYQDKLHEYIDIESLQAYVIISHDRAKVSCFERHKAGEWIYRQAEGLDTELEILPINCKLALATIYEDVRFEAIQGFTRRQITLLRDIHWRIVEATLVEIFKIDIQTAYKKVMHARFKVENELHEAELSTFYNQEAYDVAYDISVTAEDTTFFEERLQLWEQRQVQYFAIKQRYDDAYEVIINSEDID